MEGIEDQKSSKKWKQDISVSVSPIKHNFEVLMEFGIVSGKSLFTNITEMFKQSWYIDLLEDPTYFRMLITKLHDLQSQDP